MRACTACPAQETTLLTRTPAQSAPLPGSVDGRLALGKCCTREMLTQVHGSSSAYRFCFMADKPRNGQGAAPCCSSEGRTAVEPPGDQPSAGSDSIRPQHCYCRAQHEQAVRGASNREEYSPVTLSRAACSNLLLRVVGTIGHFSKLLYKGEDSTGI